MDRAFDVLGLLSSEEYRSGESLAAELGISRVAIWRQIDRLKQIGVEIKSLKGQGYKLEAEFEALSLSAINSNLSSRGCLGYHSIQISKVVDSTNAALMRLPPSKNQLAFFAEYQTAGKGRREDEWISPPGSGICLSMARCFDNPSSSFSALGLVVGIAVVSGLEALGINGLQLKWPNDVVFRGAKLAGILIELRSEVSGPSFAVIGIGLNMCLGSASRDRIDKKVIDIRQLSDRNISRNLVASTLLASLDENLRVFEHSGFKSFHEKWREFDFLFGKELKIVSGSRVETGRAEGVDDIGALCLRNQGEVKKILSGHVIELT